ncbi:MAG: type I-E CRISPR-associated protein Cas6/Cse3/CasE [Acidimicrobiales bacterium]
MGAFLTRVELNPRRTLTARLVRNRRMLRGEVLAAFPEQDLAGREGPGRVLWRLDRDDPRRLLLYCVSATRPDFSHLVERAGWPEAHTGFETRDYSRLLDQLTSGQSFAFRLTANPVHYGRVKPGEPTKRLGHVTAARQMRWLLERQDRLGIEIPLASSGEPDARVTRRERVSFTRDGDRVTLSVVTYEGRLSVVDPDRLRAALTSGVGHARAYGCGLLTLAAL